MNIYFSIPLAVIIMLALYDLWNTYQENRHG